MCELTDKLKQHVIQANWPEVERLANQLLELAPNNQVAIDAKRLCNLSRMSHSAWVRQTLESTQYLAPNEIRESHTSTMVANERRRRGRQVSQRSLDNNFLLWIDAVGGFLVCLSDEVMIGQAVPESQIDVPILADVSRRHLKICRVSGGYVAEPFGHVTINHNEISGRVILSEGDLIGLGNGVFLRFRRPHALSASARLDLESRHRTHPWADAILLMADSCVFGPNTRNHVRCPRWTEDLVLIRRADQLFCRTNKPFEIDGKVAEGQGEINLGSHVAGDDFSFSFEAI